MSRPSYLKPDAKRLFNHFSYTPNVDNLDHAAASLAYLAEHMLENDDFEAPDDSDYVAKRCKDLLKSTPELHRVLKEAHLQKSYGPLENSGEISVETIKWRNEFLI